MIESSSVPTLFEDHNESITLFKFESSFHYLFTWSISIGNWTNLTYSFFDPGRGEKIVKIQFSNQNLLVFLNLTNLPASLRFQLERIGLEFVAFCFQLQQQCLRRYVSDSISFCEISQSLLILWGILAFWTVLWTGFRFWFPPVPLQTFVTMSHR